MRRRILVFAVVVSAVGGGVWGADTEKPLLEGLEVTRNESELLVSYVVPGAFTQDVLDRLHSGIQLSFRHRAEVLGKRWLAMFNRRTLGRTVVINTVSYDTLTRRYDLQREIRAKDWPKDRTLPDRVDTSTTDSLEEVKAWMVTVDSIPLPVPPESAGRIKVKVRSELGRRLVWGMFPSTYIVTDETWLEP